MSTREDEIMTPTYRRSATFAFLGLAGGIAISLAGNLQAINLDGARPGTGSYISALIWPLALFVVIEIMLHTPWAASWRDWLTKAGVLGVVGFGAAWVSYWHLVHVLDAYGYDQLASHLGPLVVDGMMAMSTLALNRVGQARRGEPGVQPAQVVVQATPLPAVSDDLAAALANDTIDLTNATDMAITQAATELATETESYLDRLAREYPAETPTPAVPVIPAQVPTRVRRPGIEPELTLLLTAWDTAGRPLKPGEVDELLSAHFGPSTRTIRRRREALGLV